MSAITKDAVSDKSGSHVSGLGALCFGAGVLGAASGLFLVVVEPAVPADRFSYPLTASGFIAIQIWFFVQHLGLAAGSFGTWRSGAFGSSTAARSGYVIGVVGMLLLAVTELIAIRASGALYPSEDTAPLDVLYGASSIAVGIGWVIGGIAAIRAGVWSGWRGLLPLVIGIYVFVPMTPAIAAGFLPARLSITGWMLLFAVLGLAIVRKSDRR